MTMKYKIKKKKENEKSFYVWKRLSIYKLLFFFFFCEKQKHTLRENEILTQGTSQNPFIMVTFIH